MSIYFTKLPKMARAKVTSNKKVDAIRPKHLLVKVTKLNRLIVI